MLNKYKNQILLAVFIALVIAFFSVVIISDSSFTGKAIYGINPINITNNTENNLTNPADDYDVEPNNETELIDNNNAPELIKNIPDIELKQNEEMFLDLTNYFEDKDNSSLIYSYDVVEGIYISFSENAALITPELNFVGKRIMMIHASDGVNSAASNSFMVEVESDLDYYVEPEINETLNITEPVPVNQTPANETEENITKPEFEENITINQTVEQNLTEGNLSYGIEPESNLTEEILIQSDAEIGKPVKWIKRIPPDDSEQRILKVHKQAEDIVIRKNVFNQKTLVDKEKIKLNENSIADLDSEKIIKINKTPYELEIEYFTPAPEATEKMINNYKKQITISSDIHYEDVLTYTTMPSEAKKENIKLYWIVNGARQQFNDVNYIDSNNNSLVDRLEWVTPHLSNQTFEIEITVLNVQSYPVVGGNWEVRFNTSGKANLSIKPIEGTAWDYDLQFSELRCGNNSLNYSWINDSVVYNNYECNDTGYEISKVLTSGKHALEFTFGDAIAYARNLASANLTCAVRLNACAANETAVMRMSNNTNAHAEQINNSNYNYIVCCKDDDNRNNLTTASGNVVVNLSSSTNAHAEIPNTSDYAFPVFLDTEPDNLTCSYDYVSGSCVNSTCLFTMSGTTNAHVADCVTDPYNLTVCCGFNIINRLPTTGSPILNSSFGTNLTTENLTCYPQNTNDLDGDNVTEYITWYKNGSLYDVNGGAELSVEDNMVLLLHLNNDSSVGENSTFAYDYSDYDNHGTINGATWTTDGKINGALSFDGVDDTSDNRVTFSPIIGSDTTFTISTWVKWYPSAASYGTVYGEFKASTGHTQHLIYIGNTGHISFDNYPPSGGVSEWPNATLQEGVWAHVVYVQNGTTGKGYFNGQLDGTVTQETYSGDTPAIAAIGARAYTAQSGGYYYNLNGSVDEFAIFDKSLSSSEVLELYKKGEYYSENDTIDSSLTSVDDVWQCEVTPYDGTDYGISKESNNLTILSGVKYITPTAPVDASKVDRDKVSADADNQTLTVELSDSANGVNISYYANRTMPTSENNIYLGSALSNATGYANFVFDGTNASGKLKAGNYSWWANSTGYTVNGSRYVYVYGGLNLTWDNATINPNATYNEGDIVEIKTQLASLGPETGDEVNDTYLAEVNTTLSAPNGTDYIVGLIDPDAEFDILDRIWVWLTDIFKYN